MNRWVLDVDLEILQQAADQHVVADGHQQFDQLLTTEPNHAQAQQYRAKSQTLAPTEPAPSPQSKSPTGSYSTWLYLVIGAVSLVALALTVLLAVRRRRPTLSLPDPTSPGPFGTPGSTGYVDMPQSPPPGATPWPGLIPAQPTRSVVEDPGATSGLVCPTCGRAQPASAHFCADCGHSLQVGTAVADGH